MKTYEEIADGVFARRNAYVTRQKQKRKTVMKVTSAACAFALVALVGLGVAQSDWLDPATPPVDTPVATEPTTAPTEPSGYGIGGDANQCTIHSFRYHALSSKLLRHYPVEPYADSDDDDYENIVGYVEYYNIPREEFIEMMKWDVEKLDELIPDTSGSRYCPYTYNQYLDAIYGDDEELTTWVFAPENTWPEIEPEIEE